MIDAEVLAERAAIIERHLRRVAERLPERPEGLRPMTDESDAVVLHLWLAIQIAVDLAVQTCVRLGLGSPSTYGDAFRRLQAAGGFERLRPYTASMTLAERIATHDDVPVDDHIVLLRDAAWSNCQRILEIRGDRGPSKARRRIGASSPMNATRSAR
jgi:hypothetical protein